MSSTIYCMVDVPAEAGYMSEFGLSLFIEANGRRILFDTGAGEALIPNAVRMGIDLDSATEIILSHGHYDHTGGLAKLVPPPRTPVYVGRGIAESCWSLHDDGSKHRITMPPESQLRHPGPRTTGSPTAPRSAARMNSALRSSTPTASLQRWSRSALQERTHSKARTRPGHLTTVTSY